MSTFVTFIFSPRSFSRDNNAVESSLSIQLCQLRSLHAGFFVFFPGEVGIIAPKRTPAKVKLTRLRIDEELSSVPRIRNPTVKSRTISMTAVISAVNSLFFLCFFAAAHPAAAAQRKLSTELRIPIPCSPIPVRLAASVAAVSSTQAQSSQTAAAQNKTVPAGK